MEKIEEEGDICKVCRCPGTEEQPLFYPCDCKGSIRFVHQDCLQQWLKHTNSKRCELCRRQYKFKPIYKQDAPSILPLSDVATGLIFMLLKHTATISRYLLVMACWLFVVPVGTSCIWNFFFQRTIETTSSQIMVHLIIGSVLFAIIIVGSLGTLSLVEYIRSLKLLETLNGEIEQNTPNGNEHNGENENVANENQARVVDVLGFGDALFGLLDPRVEDENQQGEDENEVELEELIGLKGSLVAFFWHIFSVIAINGLILGLFFLLPFFAGRLTRKIAGSNFDSLLESTQWNQDMTTTVLGYTVNIIIAIFYIKILSTQSQHRPLSTVEKQIAAVLLFAYTCVKVVSLSICELVLFPIFCGLIIDGCTLDLFGTSLHDRIDYAYSNPILCLSIHWFVGFIFMFNFGTFIRYLRSLVRPGLLWFLRDPDSPDFAPLRDMIKESLYFHIRRFTLSAILYAALVLLLVYCPVHVTKVVFGDILPLNTFTEPLYEASFDLFLLHVLFPVWLKFFRPKKSITKILKLWLTVVGIMLDLSEYIFGKNSNNDNHEVYHRDNPRENAIALDNQQQQQVGDPHENVIPPEPAVVQPEDNNQPTQSNIYKPEYFGSRILLLLLLAWITTLFIIVLLLSLPIKLGRAVLSVFVEIADVYAFLTGFCIIWGISRIIRMTVRWLKPYVYLYLFVENNRFMTALPQIQSLCQIIYPDVVEGIVISSKVAIISLLWFGFVPFIVGLWINFTIIVPLRVDIHQTPTLYPYYTYALGLLYLKIWYKLMMLDGINNQWRDRFNKVHQDGIKNIDLLYILSQIILPVVHFLLIRLCVPYVMIKLLLPALDIPEENKDHWARFSYLNFSTLVALINSLSSATSYLIMLHQKIRDDKYLIGEQLQNIGETEDHINKTDLQSDVHDGGELGLH